MNPFSHQPAGLTFKPLSGGSILIECSHAARRKSPVLLPGEWTRWMALAKTGPTKRFWNLPSFGDALSPVPAETQALFWEREDGDVGVLLPLVDGDGRCTVRGAENGVVLEIHAPEKSGMGTRRAALAAVGKDPAALMLQLMGEASRLLKTFRLRSEKPEPAYVDWLGWCTWDAFYTTVSARKVIQGLKSFAGGGVCPRYLIVDDGWQDVQDVKLFSFGTNRQFPKGLAPLIERAKTEFGIEWFGVWHSLAGYWCGVHPEGPLGKKYPLIRDHCDIRRWVGKEDTYAVDPERIGEFFQEYYRILREAGVDIVKVDVQSGLSLVLNSLQSDVPAMRAYQQALQSAAGYYFNNALIHCMCHGSDVAFNMNQSLLMRNSSDFFPDRPVAHQQKHIQTNALNSLWSSTFSLPDWDMFQSDHPSAPFHAAARAISGGPVYVSDKPGKQNFKLLRKMCLEDGRVLRCEQPALPARDRIFVDCLKEACLEKIYNRNGSIGVLGLFHCRENPEPIDDSFCAADVTGLKGSRFAAYFHTTGAVQVVTRRQRLKVTLSALDFELVTFSPVVDGVAPLGLLEKFNGSRAVENWSVSTEGISLEMIGEGVVGIYAEQAPARIRANGKICKTTFDQKSGLIRFRLPSVSHKKR